MDLPFLKNDITDFLPAPELKIAGIHTFKKKGRAK